MSLNPQLRSDAIKLAATIAAHKIDPTKPYETLAFTLDTTYRLARLLEKLAEQVEGGLVQRNVQRTDTMPPSS